MTEQARAVREVVEAMQDVGKVITDEAVASAFGRAPRARVGDILLALKVLGFVAE
jgi:alkylated DNA nucleotide flippase Atl1